MPPSPINRRHKKMLDEVLTESSITDDEAATFRRLRDGLRLRGLTNEQVEVLERVHRQLGLGADRSPRVQRAADEAPPVPFEVFAATLPWGEKAMSPPPSRRASW